MITLLPGATSWNRVADLPRPLYFGRATNFLPVDVRSQFFHQGKASVVGGKVRVTGTGNDNDDGNLEVLRV